MIGRKHGNLSLIWTKMLDNFDKNCGLIFVDEKTKDLVLGSDSGLFIIYHYGFTKKQNGYQEQGPRKGIVIIVITILLNKRTFICSSFDKKNTLDTTNQALFTRWLKGNLSQAQLNQVKAEFEKDESR